MPKAKKEPEATRRMRVRREVAPIVDRESGFIWDPVPDALSAAFPLRACSPGGFARASGRGPAKRPLLRLFEKRRQACRFAEDIQACTAHEDRERFLPMRWRQTRLFAESRQCHPYLCRAAGEVLGFLPRYPNRRGQLSR